MELIQINKTEKEKVETTLKIGKVVRTFSFHFYSGEIFAVDFPEELRKILRPLPVSVTQTLVKIIEDYVTSGVKQFPVKLETKKPERFFIPLKNECS